MLNGFIDSSKRFGIVCRIIHSSDVHATLASSRSAGPANDETEAPDTEEKYDGNFQSE